MTQSGGLTNAIIRMARVEVALVGSCPCSSAGTRTCPAGQAPVVGAGGLLGCGRGSARAGGRVLAGSGVQFRMGVGE